MGMATEAERQTLSVAKAETSQPTGAAAGGKQGGMHAATLNSPRMRATLKALADGRWRTTAEIHERTGSMAVSTDLSALRHKGIPVEHCTAKRADGRRLDWYRLAEGESDCGRKRKS